MSLLAAGLAFCMSLWYNHSLGGPLDSTPDGTGVSLTFMAHLDSGLVMKGHLLAERPPGNPLWSGENTGPEASLLVLPLFIVVSLAMWILWRKGPGRFRSGSIGRPENIDQSIPNG